MSLWGNCKKCHQPLTDSDYIYGDGDYCESCNIKMAIKTLVNLKKEIKRHLK